MNKPQYSKKGQMGGAVGAIVGLITGVGVATLVLIFVGTLGGQTYNLVESQIDEIANNQITEQLIAVRNNTATDIGHQYIQTGTLSIANASNGYHYTVNNFTIDYTAGTIQPISTLTPNSTNLYINYTWGDLSIRTNVKAGISSGFSALQQTGHYLPIIVLAVIIAIVLALVLTMGGNKQNNGSAL